MADAKNGKEVEDNAQVYVEESFDDSKLQRIKSGNGILQADYTINAQILTFEDQQQSKEDSLKSQNMLKKEPINMNTQLGIPHTDLVEATSMPIDSILGNQNTFEQQNNYTKQPLIKPNPETSNETEAQQQASFEFKNHRNQILVQKFIQPFIKSENTAIEIIKDQVVDAFGPSQVIDNLQDQQVINAEIMGISESLRNFRQKSQVEKQADFMILNNGESMRKNEAGMNVDIVYKNLGDCGSGHEFEGREATHNVISEEKTKQQYPVRALVPKIDRNVIPGNKQDFTINLIFTGLQFIDGELFEIIGGLSNVADDSERELHLLKMKFQKLEETEIPNATLYPISENNEESQEVPLNARFSEAVHAEEFNETEIHPRTEYSISGIMAEKEKIKADAIYLTMIDETQSTTEEVSLEQNQLGKTSIGEKCFKNMDSSENEEGFTIEKEETNRIKKLTKSTISEQDPKNTSQGILRRAKLENKFVSSGNDERLEQFLLDLKSTQVAENSEIVNKIHGEYRELLEIKKFQEQALYEKQQENAINVFIGENMITSSKLLEEILEEKKKSSELHENKAISKSDKKSDSVSTTSDQKHGMDKQENDENIVADNANKLIVKSLKFVNVQEDKNFENNKGSKLFLQKKLKCVSKYASNTILPKSTVKRTTKTLSTATKIVPKSKDAKKSNQMMVDQKSTTKSSVFLPLISRKTAILKEKNVEEVGLKHIKNVTNSRNVKPLKQNTTPTKTLTVPSKLTQKKPQASRNFAKTKLESNNDSKNIPKDFVRDYQKREKDAENDEKGLAKKKKKIGIIDSKPLIWKETLIPTYEQTWKIYEPANQIFDKIDIVLVKMMEKKLETDKKIKNLKINGSELIWEIKKISEFMETEVTKCITLSDRDEINIPECYTSSNKDKEILSPLDSSKIRKEQKGKISVEEEISMEDSNGRRKIEISHLVSSKSSESIDLSLKVESEISLEQVTFDAIKRQNVGTDTNKDPGNSHKNIKNDTVLPFKSNASETQSEVETDTNEKTDKTLAIEDEGKTGRINESEEKSDINLERSDNGKESESRMVNERITSEEIQFGERTTVAAGSGFGQQSQPELEMNDDHKHGQESRSKHHHHQRRGQFGGMYSDVPEECRHNTAGKDSSHKHHQNYSRQEYSGISGNTELQGNYQQQLSENQNYSRKQQQQLNNTNRGYYQDYAGQQGHRKRNKRNKKSRNWFKQ
ncbi:hypothetical protein X798_00617 [Onchocerca flexuosa]|uniref:Uncharacterized protein n=1 Tax=Onchocerca flexuosa TaxID=387005 RepID=A0A238C5A1_9BILA|nr:hypothetical protein X798_00617 [Onchocerca flexuosa]